MAENRKVVPQERYGCAHPASYRPPAHASWTPIWDNRKAKPGPTTAAEQTSPERFDRTVKALRDFFAKREFKEVNSQCRPSILAAWEFPERLQAYNARGTEWPLPQSGIVWLERELRKDPDATGFFCLTNSYGAAAAAQPRPIFEFAFRGDQTALRTLVTALMTSLLPHNFEGDGRIVTNSSLAECPFWNVAAAPSGENGSQRARNCDAHFKGTRLVSAAERTQDKNAMSYKFCVSYGGRYSLGLYHYFGQARTEAEFARYVNDCSFLRSTGSVDVMALSRYILSESGTGKI